MMLTRITSKSPVKKETKKNNLTVSSKAIETIMTCHFRLLVWIRKEAERKEVG